jgi:hypothetical protein
LVSCRVAPVAAGATMIAFQTVVKPQTTNLRTPQNIRKRAQ